MIFDTMRPEFIRLLPAYGTLCIVFMLACVRAGVQSSGQLSSKLKALAYLSLAVVFAAAFIAVTAPSQRYFILLRAFLLCSCAVSVFVCAAAAAVYLRTNKAFFEPVIRYKDFLDDIDDYVFIFNSAGEQVFHNNPKSKEALLPADAAALRTAAVLTENSRLTCGIPKDSERKIVLNKRHFIVNTSLIRDKNSRKAGVALILHDITEEQQLIDELEEKNVLITKANEELMQAMDIDEALFTQEEREKIAAEIRQELEAKISETIRTIDALNLSGQESRAQQEKNLHGLAGQLRHVLADIRRIVYQTKER